MDGKSDKLQKIIDGSRHIVFFGGAGVSTESGIPDFRSENGLYSQKFKYPAEYMLSRTFFDSNTEEFFDFFRSVMIPSDAIKPNAAHYKIAEMEEKGRLDAVITQNIDGLHQMAGSKNVIELHGSVWRNHCIKCGKFYPTNKDEKGIPRCKCGGIIKPDVILYEETLYSADIEAATKALLKADLLIIGGTSLSVFPAAGLIGYFGGENIIIINKSSTPYDRAATLVIDGSIAQIMSGIKV